VGFGVDEHSFEQVLMLMSTSVSMGCGADKHGIKKVLKLTNPHFQKILKFTDTVLRDFPVDETISKGSCS
jgi:hypothetical protein